MREKKKPEKSLSTSLLRKIEIPLLSVYSSNNAFDFFHSAKFKEEPEEKPKENVKPTPISKRKGAAAPSTPINSNTSTPATTPNAVSPSSNGKGGVESGDASKEQPANSTPTIDTQNIPQPTPPSTPEIATSPTSPIPPSVSIPPSPSVVESPETEKEPVLTEVQLYLVKALKSFGGSAPLTSIQDYVSKGWSKLRKRDGTRYTYDYRRVISASLANTSSVSPLFEKHPTKPNWWVLGPRAKSITMEPHLLQDEDNSTVSSPSDEQEEAKGSDDGEEEEEQEGRKRRVETKREEEEDSSSTPATPNANSTPSETPPSTPSGAGADRKIKKEFSDLVDDKKPPKKKARKSSIIPPPVVSNDALSSRESRKLLEYSRRIELNTERRESGRSGRETTTRRLSGIKGKDIKDNKDVKEGKYKDKAGYGKGKGKGGKRRYQDYDEEDDEDEDQEESEGENIDEDDEEGKKQTKRQRRWSDEEEEEEEEVESGDEKGKQTPGKGKQTPKGKRRADDDDDEEEYDSEEDGRRQGGKGRKKQIKTPEGKTRTGKVKDEEKEDSTKSKQPTPNKDNKTPVGKDKLVKPPTPKTPKERLKQQQKEAAEKAQAEKEPEQTPKKDEGEEENKLPLSRKYTRKPKEATTPVITKEERPEIKEEESKSSAAATAAGSPVAPSTPGTPSIASPTTPSSSSSTSTPQPSGQGTPGRKPGPRKHFRKNDKEEGGGITSPSEPVTTSDLASTPSNGSASHGNNFVGEVPKNEEASVGETVHVDEKQEASGLPIPPLDKLPWKADAKQNYSPGTPDDSLPDPPPRGPGRPRKRVWQEPDQESEDSHPEDDEDEDSEDEERKLLNQPHSVERAQRALNREKNKADLKKREAEEEEKRMKKKEEKMERLAENKKRRESDKQARMESKTLGHLQVIISAAITQNGGSASFDYICNYAKKRYSSTGNMSINPEVLADAVKVSLDEKSGVKFKKDPHRPGSWMLSEPATPVSKKDKLPPQTKVLSSTRTVVVHPQPPSKKGRPKKGNRGYSDSDESSGSEDDENESEDSPEWDEGDEEGGVEGSGAESEGGGEGKTRGSGFRGKGRARGSRGRG